jgi:4-amino-4-deoxy-L-arabinose transferase-like glycosyltransferase
VALGLLAAAMLCVARLGLDPQLSGVPLLDLARLIRYDIVVPVWVLLSCLCFLWALRRGSQLGFVATGALVGLATLSHVYGAFILPVFAIVLLWCRGWRGLRSAAPYLIAAGWLLALLPWVIYALQDPEAYVGQTLFDQAAGRFDLFNPAFYWHNLSTEHGRYRSFFGGGGEGLLEPRVGIWLLLAGVLGANLILWPRALRGHSSVSDRLLLVAPLVLSGLLALLLNEKKYNYLVLVLPFFALQMAYVLNAAWQWGRRARALQLLFGAVLAAAILEAGVGVAQSLRAARQASPYMSFTHAVAQTMPLGARVLAVHMYWIGMSQSDMRSLDLPFRFSNPNYYQPQPLSMEQALKKIAPAYLMVDPLIERAILRPTQPAETEILARQKRDFTESVRQHCASIVAVVDGPEYADYGPMKIYHCDW